MAYTKTDWVEHETVVSAELLNKIEGQLQTVTVSTDAHEMSIKSTETQVEQLKEDYSAITTSIAAQTEKLIKLEGETTSLKSSVSDGKSKVAAAITGMGVSTTSSSTFDTMAANIKKIKNGLGVGDTIPKDNLSDTIVQKWDYKTSMWNSVTNIIPCDDGRVFYCSDSNSAAYLNGSTGNESKSYSSLGSGIVSSAIDPMGNLFVAHSDYTLLCVNPNNGVSWRDSIYFVNKSIKINTAEFVSSSFYLGGSDGSIYLATFVNIDPTSPAISNAHTGGVKKIISPDQYTMYSYGDDNKLNKYYQSSTLSISKSFAHPNNIVDIAAKYLDDTFVYTIDNRGYLRKINMSTGTATWSRSTGKTNLTCITVAPDGTIYCGDTNGYIHKFNDTGYLSFSKQVITSNNKVVSILVADNKGDLYFSDAKTPNVRKMVRGFTIKAIS